MRSPAAVPGLARLPDSGKGRGRRVPAAGAGGRARNPAGRRAWPARPASWGLGRCRHRPGGTPRPPSRRPAPGLALGPCRCTCPGAPGARAARPGRAPRPGVSGPGRGLAPGASGSPRAPPGRPRALGLTRLGYGAGEVGAGSLRGPSGALLASPGAGSPGGPGARAAAGWGRVCPPRALRSRSGRRVAFARRPNVVGAKPRPPLPFRLAGRARPPSDARCGRSWRPPARGATAWDPAPRGLGQPFQVPGASGCNSSPSEDALASGFGPHVWLRWPPSPPCPFRGEEEGRRLAARAGLRNGLPSAGRGARVSRCRQDPWSSAVNVTPGTGSRGCPILAAWRLVVFTPSV